MTKPVVAVHDLHKTYRVFARPADRLFEALLRKPRHTPFHALQGVTFDVPKGEGLGIIGENGAGKSTLLKILAGVTAPSSGEVHIDRPVASILELGSAFHQELTGRENIMLNAAMLGLSREQIAEKTPQIIAFSELEQFIEQPIKTYSTGMVMRLGFSIATQVEPTVLIIDEALSVGDGYFQQKCMLRLREYVDSGGTLLICSHAMYYISAFCQHVVWMRNGRIEAYGPVQQIVPQYEAFLQAKTDRSSEKPSFPAVETGSAGALGDARLLSPESIRCRDTLQLEISWTSQSSHSRFHIAVGLNRHDETEVACFMSHRERSEPWTGSTSYRVELEIPDIPLVKGRYKLYVFLLGEDGLHVHDTRIIEDAFTVEYDEYPFGMVTIPHHWKADSSGEG